MRIAGQMKMGYYPADPELAQRLGRLLTWPEKPVHMLDPSCGKGEALCNFGPASAVRYGVELDHNRYLAACDAIGADRVLYAGFEQCGISPRSFGACWLNPPYDDEIGGGKRTELEFLSRVTPLLVEGGIVVFFFSHLAWRNDRMKSYIAGQYENVRLYRHPPTERNGYADTTVYILIGQRRRKEVGCPDRPELEDLPAEGMAPLWTVPTGYVPSRWVRCGLTDAEIAQLADRSALWQQEASGPIALGRPLLPPKLGHIPMILASGRVNGLIHDHVARAKVSKHFKVVDTKVSTDAKGNETKYEVQKETVKLSIRCLVKRDGRVSVRTF